MIGFEQMGFLQLHWEFNESLIAVEAGLVQGSDIKGSELPLSREESSELLKSRP